MKRPGEVNDNDALEKLRRRSLRKRGCLDNVLLNISYLGLRSLKQVGIYIFQYTTKY